MIGIRTVARVARELRRDVAAAHERDPAARGVSSLEILALWPGVHALLAHRVAHALADAGVPLVPGAIAATARTVTGIEIHPPPAGRGSAPGKRHPTVEDNVTIGSGAKLLGPIRISHGAKIGANAVVVHDVPPNSTVVGNPGHTVRVEGRKPEGPDADWVHLPDPIADALKALSRRIGELEAELDEARGEPAHPRGDVLPLRPVRGPNPAGG